MTAARQLLIRLLLVLAAEAALVWFFARPADLAGLDIARPLFVGTAAFVVLIWFLGWTPQPAGGLWWPLPADRVRTSAGQEDPETRQLIRLLIHVRGGETRWQAERTAALFTDLVSARNAGVEQLSPGLRAWLERPRRQPSTARLHAWLDEIERLP